MKKQNIKAYIENVDGKMVAVASDDSLDRHGDSIKQDVWDLRNFRKNPVLLMSHQYQLPPVGIAKNFKVVDNKLIFEPVFHEITQSAREVKQMFLDGIMRAFSVGFLPNEKKNELLEISVVSVPANPNAIVFEKSVSDDDKAKIKSWIKGETDRNKKVKDQGKAIDEVMEHVKSINIRLNNIEKVGTKQKLDVNIIEKSLEKLNKSLSYLNRKVVKKGK
ncbi:hypothetical protein HOK15_04175 [Candidatus Falkowbacteria bacterium]|nr:hypothetical protein [Candidatus Falkowbacteria bacterium]